MSNELIKCWYKVPGRPWQVALVRDLAEMKRIGAVLAHELRPAELIQVRDEPPEEN